MVHLIAGTVLLVLDDLDVLVVKIDAELERLLVDIFATTVVLPRDVRVKAEDTILVVFENGHRGTLVVALGVEGR